MSRSAIRTIACAGAVASTLLLTSPAIAVADDETTGGGAETVTTGGDVGGSGDGGGSDGSADGTTQPSTSVGNGRTGEPEPVSSSGVDDGGLSPLNNGDGKPKSKVNGFVIPVPRIPSHEEFARPGLLPPTAFVGAFEVPNLTEVFRAFAQPEPEPEPPGPAFRTQQEDAPPVIDATGNSSGGSDGVAGGELPVFQAPIVVVPPAPPPAAVRIAPRATPAPAPAVTPGAQPAAAGVRAPLIRGTLPPSKVTPPNSLGPANTTAQAGYPRYLRNPTVGELAAIALPGVAGLIFLTFSGGVIGYRQANSTRFVRSDAARFLP